MKADFTLAKKFSRNTVKGLELRSASLTRAVVFNTSGKGYEKVREAYDVFVYEKTSGEKVPSLKIKGIGKSYEITGDDTLLFLGRINFVNESHNEFVEFYNQEADSIGEPAELVLDEKAALLKMTADVEDEEKFFDGLLPIIEKYDIGILKK
jgi:hypothetical protein